MLDSLSQALIGTNTPPPAGLAANLRCGSGMSRIHEQIFDRLQFPGTYNEYYIMEGHEVQLTGGQYVNVGLEAKHKRIPAKSLKSALITESR